jgi:hypothetical protein
MVRKRGFYQNLRADCGVGWRIIVLFSNTIRFNQETPIILHNANPPTKQPKGCSREQPFILLVR